MTTKSIQIEIDEILEASRQVKQGLYYKGNLLDILKQKKRQHIPKNWRS